MLQVCDDQGGGGSDHPTTFLRSSSSAQGVGGLWDQVLDVSSFAGGFVCNPTLLQTIANMSNVAFPKFVTNQFWQFGWAAWYSERLPSRPMQFTEQEPHHRVPFWSFPHRSVPANTTTAQVSGLYDRVIEDNIARLAAAVPQGECEKADDGWMKTLLVVVGMAIGVGGLCFLCLLVRARTRDRMQKKGRLGERLLPPEQMQIES